MTDDRLNQAATLLKVGDKAAARHILKPLLQQNPTADAWYLAANAMESKEQAISCLKQALTLDEWHNKANAMLTQLEQVESIMTRGTATVKQVEVTHKEIQPLPEIKRNVQLMEYQKRDIRRKKRQRMGCLMTLALQFSCGLIMANMVGMFPGTIGHVTQFLGGPEPVVELEGTPIENVPFAAATIEPSQSKRASSQDIDVMDHGFNHEYYFDAEVGDVVAIYIQFISVDASDVGTNVLIFDPNNLMVNATNICIELGDEGILGGWNNTTIQCTINRTGRWKFRLLGIEGESIGIYFSGVRFFEGIDLSQP